MYLVTSIQSALRTPLPFFFVLLSAGVLAQVFPSTDADGDGIADARGNCLEAGKPTQRGTDANGFGNACDIDMNNDGVVNVVDLGLFRLVFFTADADADSNGDGVVKVTDLGALRAGFLRAPGSTWQVVFTGQVSDSWFEAGNWRPTRVPLITDNAIVADTSSVAAGLGTGLTPVQVLGPDFLEVLVEEPEDCVP